MTGSIIDVKLDDFLQHINFLRSRGKIMDFRIVIVLAPLAVAASWAIFNIGAAALNQLSNMRNEE